MSLFKKSVRWVRSLPLYYSIGGGVIIVGVIFIGIHAATRSSDASTSTPPEVTHVQIASVESLSSQSAEPVPVTGTVTSLDQASILAQSSGEVTELDHQLGDYVPAGGIIAQLENSSQRAAVLQAQGQYDAAEASFKNTSGTGAQNSGITATQAAQAVANAQTSLQTSMQSLYAALDDAIHTKADALFNQPRTNPQLLLTVPDSQLVITLQNERAQLEITLANASSVANDDASADVQANFSVMSSDANGAITFLNNLVDAVNKALPSSTITASQIAGYQSTIGTARTEVTSALAALNSANTSYDNAVASAAAASNTAGAGTANNISAAQASVEEAQGSLDAAEAALEKTIIRSPISGTIVSLPLTQGGYVNASAEVADVSNPGALEIDAYVTPDDAKTLAVGGTALIDGDTEGAITSIAPALDPTTGKILVKIGIVGSQSALTDGDTVSVSINRATDVQTQSAGTASSTVLIPIIAVKITPEGPVVFEVSASSTLEQIPVTLGTILGDQVTVLSGITPQTVIVEDARGLSQGESVVVDK